MNSELGDNWGQDLTRRWHEVGASLGNPFRVWAWGIRDRARVDLETLWRLADFAQACVKFPSLLLLARGFRDPKLHEVLFQTALPSALQRPTFGTWIAFFRQAMKALRRSGVPSPFAWLSRFGQAGLKEIDWIVHRRNCLAHGPAGRYEVIEEDVREMSERVLKIAREMRELFSHESPVAEQGLHCLASPGGPAAAASSCYPFVIPQGHEEGGLLLYDALGDKEAVFHSAKEAVPQPALHGVIKQYLAGRPAEREATSLAQLTGNELLARCAALLRDFRLRIQRGDVFATDWFFSELPAFAGRPSLGKHLVEAFCSTHQPLVCHVFGRRGIGKRPFLADLLEELQRREQVVVPLFAADALGRPLEARWNEALRLAGGVTELAAAVGRTLPEACLILAIDDVSKLLATPARAEELGRLLRDRSSLPQTHFLLVSDTLEKIAAPSAEGPDVLQLPLPPMEDAAAEEFYGLVSSRPGHEPLSEWRALPPGARLAARVPSDLVSLCRKYHGRAVPPTFSEFDDREDTWQRDVIAVPDRARLLREMAEYVLRTKSREVPASECAGLASIDKVWQRTRDDLRNLGILAETVLARGEELVFGACFVEYHWLVRALLLALPLDGAAPAGDAPRWQEIFARCDEFTPLCDAAALWAEQKPDAEFSQLFGEVIARRPQQRGRLVESLLARAYTRPRLLERLIRAALAEGDESVLKGCAAAAQQMIADGGQPAVRQGTSLYERLFDVCRARGWEGLEAALLNEYAHYGLAPSDWQEKRGYFALARQKAQRTGLDALAHVATNNMVSLDLDQAAAWLGGDPQRAEQVARRAMADLSPYCELAESRENWQRCWQTWQLTARAQALLPGDEAGAAGEFHQRGIALCRRFGSATELALAHDGLGCWLAERGEFDAALGHHQQAVHWMRIGGDPAGEASCLSHRGLTRLRQFDAAGEAQRSALHAAWEDCRQGKRLLERVHSGRAPGQDVCGEVWANMASALERMGQIHEALASAQQSAEHFRAGGNRELFQAMMACVERLSDRLSNLG